MQRQKTGVERPRSKHSLYSIVTHAGHVHAPWAGHVDVVAHVSQMSMPGPSEHAHPTQCLLRRSCGHGNPSLPPFLSVLLEMLKDKSRPVVAAQARGPRGRKRRHGGLEETAEPQLEASCLEKCKDLLRATLTHWGPGDPLPGPTQGSVGQTIPKSKTLSSAHAAVSLVASWVLRSLAERPVSRAEVTRLLDWLKSHILPQPMVVADLLGDSAVKTGIFKLYNHHCSAQGLVGPAQDVACKFSTVMLQLLVAQGRKESPFHSVAEALCLDSLNEKEEAKRGNVGSFVTTRDICGVGKASASNSDI